jgi:hypothetical protein
MLWLVKSYRRMRCVWLYQRKFSPLDYSAITLSLKLIVQWLWKLGHMKFNKLRVSHTVLTAMRSSNSATHKWTLINQLAVSLNMSILPAFWTSPTKPCMHSTEISTSNLNQEGNFIRSPQVLVVDYSRKSWNKPRASCVPNVETTQPNEASPPLAK